ncbi:hypothetical protein CCH79_00015501, partial [Gambusia affinis]
MPVRLASPLPQAAHVGVSGVQGAAQSNQEAKKLQDCRGAQSLHGPEGRMKAETLRDDCKTAPLWTTDSHDGSRVEEFDFDPVGFWLATKDSLRCEIDEPDVAILCRSDEDEVDVRQSSLLETSSQSADGPITDTEPSSCCSGKKGKPNCSFQLLSLGILSVLLLASIAVIAWKCLPCQKSWESLLEKCDQFYDQNSGQNPGKRARLYCQNASADLVVVDNVTDQSPASNHEMNFCSLGQTDNNWLWIDGRNESLGCVLKMASVFEARPESLVFSQMAEAEQEKSRGLKFAEQLLLSHGWEHGESDQTIKNQQVTVTRLVLTGSALSPGKGLGRAENGISEAIKVKVKCDKGGIGHREGEQFSFHWWDHVFNKASSSLQVEAGQNGIRLKKTPEEGEEEEGAISNKKPRKSLQNKSKLYGRFVKSSTLLSGQEEPEPKAPSSDSSSSDEEEEQKLDLSSTTRLSDADLMKVCGGRTAHKGARHGLTMSAKLARLEQQEAEFLTKYGKKSQTGSSPVVCDTATHLEETNRSKKKKKKKKKSAQHDADPAETGRSPEQFSQSDRRSQLDVEVTMATEKQRRKKSRKDKSVTEKPADDE